MSDASFSRPPDPVPTAVLTLAAALNEIVEELAASGVIDNDRLLGQLLKIEGADKPGLAKSLISYVAQPLATRNTHG